MKRPTLIITDPAKIRQAILSQPHVSAETMAAQIRAGIAWSREISRQTSSTETVTIEQAGATEEAEGGG